MRRFLVLILSVSLLVLPVRAEAQPKYAVLTFDDGPSGRFTRRLLEGLKERDVKATFLLCGYRIKDYPEEARQIAQEGHEIGIHGYSHDCMCCMSREQVGREVLDTAALLPKAWHMPAFAPSAVLALLLKSTARPTSAQRARLSFSLSRMSAPSSSRTTPQMLTLSWAASTPALS